MKILVAIANFGSKNEQYLKRLLVEYRSIKNHQVHLVVHSDIPKNLGPDIEVITGLPTSNPRSLPFAHKALFAERMAQYDLFIYSEDDTLITERNIDAYVEVTRVLPEEYIAGFIRYEISETGRKYYSTMHAHYHWDPNSVQKIGDYTFARYTNDHSASFIVTQRQLAKAIGSAGFLLPPREGRYGMLETAATDPYTQCGMKKLICISHLEDFCLHHLPNAYLGKIGVDASWADREIERIKSLCGEATIRGPLVDTTTLLEDAAWEKRYYEPSRDDILSLIPNGIKRVLSVGCGCGSTESEILKRGIDVVGIPLDCVVQASAEAKGIKVVPPDFASAKITVRGGDFDCILFTDILQHLPDPLPVLEDFLDILAANGSVIVSVPNFHHPSVVRKRMLGNLLFSMAHGRRSFDRCKIHFTTRRMVSSWLEKCGLQVIRSARPVEEIHEAPNGSSRDRLKGIFPRKIVVLSKRASTRGPHNSVDNRRGTE